MLPALLALALVGCGKRESRPDRDPTLQKWKVARGIASFLVRGKRGVTKGAVLDVRGTFETDVADLTRTRGTITMDLASLAMSSFEDAAQNAKQTAGALSWLHVAEPATSADSGEGNRWATFALRNVTSAEPRDLSGDAGSPRKVRAKATGDLTFHGRTVTHEVELEATVAIEGGEAKRMFVQTVGDVVVPLSAHDLRPPNGAEGADALDGAASADVGLQFAAEPAP
jgi:polyisoprenoid-binding protein YceI